MNVAVKEFEVEKPISKATLKAKEKYEGKVFKTNNYGDVVVLEYISSRDITIRFINTSNVRKVFLPQLKSGKIRDNELKPVYKVGVMDIPNAVGTRDHPKSYRAWNNMLQRCYNENMRSKHTTYSDCEVSDDFKYYSKFKEWAEKQVGYDQENWGLDKDILVKGNKIYSAENCAFVPNEINTLILSGKSYRGDLPVGVILDRSPKTPRYRARLSKEGKYYCYGSYPTPEEAYYAYKEAKEAYIKEVADKYKDVIDSRVYKALYEWTISIDD